MTKLPSRSSALDLLHEYTKSISLRKHALAVESAMLAYARKFGEDPESWGIAGLLHDFDYERYPDFPDHPTKGNEILAERGYPEDVRQAILGHVPAMNVVRETRMSKALFACDELCGFIVACSLVRPNGLKDLKPSSVKKKLKDKHFARGVNREDIMTGVAELGEEFDDHIRFVVGALQTIESELSGR